MPLRMLEIGSWEGRSSIWWLDNLLKHPASTLMCVDPCIEPNRYRRLLRNIATHPLGHKITLARCESDKLLPNMPATFYDWIYVDGSHEGCDVLRDACLSFNALKRGGTLIFDDYGADETVEPGITITPKIAIDGFIAAHRPMLEILHTGYQIAIRKI